MDKTFRLLIKEISQCHVLPENEQLALIKQIKTNNDPEAINKLIKSHIKIILTIATKYQNDDVSVPELVNEGALGLLQAVKRFNEKYENKFISYAVWWIRQAMLQHVGNSKLIRPPADNYSKQKTIEKAKEMSLQKFQNINLDYITKVTSKSLQELDSLEPQTFISLSKPFNDDSDLSIEDYLKVDEEDQLSKLIKTSLCDKLLKGIKGKPRKIVELYFGFIGEPKNLEDIAKKFDISKERVRQIKEKTIKTIRRNYFDLLKIK